MARTIDLCRLRRSFLRKDRLLRLSGSITYENPPSGTMAGPTPAPGVFIPRLCQNVERACVNHAVSGFSSALFSTTSSSELPKSRLVPCTVGSSPGFGLRGYRRKTNGRGSDPYPHRFFFRSVNSCKICANRAHRRIKQPEHPVKSPRAIINSGRLGDRSHILMGAITRLCRVTGVKKFPDFPRRHWFSSDRVVADWFPRQSSGSHKPVNPFFPR